MSVAIDGSMTAVLREAMAHDLVNVENAEADLEEIFLTYYRDTEAEKAVS